MPKRPRDDEQQSELSNKRLKNEENAVGWSQYLLNGVSSLFVKMVKRQYSTIHDAARAGSVIAVQAFLDEGVDVNAQLPSWQQRTPLHFAAGSGHIEVVRLLLDRGANIEAQDDSEQTSLHHCTYGGHEERDGVVKVIQVLLERGANINAQNDLGNTPLHIATIFAHDANVLQALLAARANVEVQNNQGETPIVLAFERGNFDVVRLLQQHGAVLPEHLREEMVNGAFGQANGNQSVHTVSVHVGVSNSVKKLQSHYRFSQEDITKEISELTEFVEAFPEDPSEGMKDKSAAAKRGLALLKSINFVDSRSGVSLREALSLTWRGLNDEKEQAKTPAELKEIITTWLYNTQRNYNLSKKGVDNGQADSPSCASGSFNQAVYTLQGRHCLVNIPVVEKATITLKIPALANEHFDRFSDEERRRYIDESTEDLSPALIDRLRELISKDLHAEFDPFNSPGLNVNEIIEEGLKFSLPYVTIHRLQDSVGKREVEEESASASSSESPVHHRYDLE